MNKILLFIPMYNCKNQIVRVLGQVDSKYDNIVKEVIIVNNRSTDGGDRVVMEYLNGYNGQIPIKLLTNDENYGLGGSHKVAFNYAIENKFDYVIVLHGDDQGNINDFLPLLKGKDYESKDCILGARFMRGSKIQGYSKLRIFGNIIFNLLFTIVLRQKIYDLGSGLNMYKVASLKTKYYLTLPDTLYFNDCMLLMLKHKKMSVKFVPITWREEDQISNNKLYSFSISLLKMLYQYTFHKTKYLNSDMRNKKIASYSAKIIKEVK